MSKQIKSPNLVSRRHSQKDSSTAKPDKAQSQKTKRVSKYRASEEAHQRFKREFPPELIVKLIN